MEPAEICTISMVGHSIAFKDGRLPDEVDFWNNEKPPWVYDGPTGEQSAQSGSSPPEGPQPQTSPRPGTTVQPKKMPRPSTGGGATSSTHAAFRAGPGSTSQDHTEQERDENWSPNEDWMKRKKPSNVEVRLHVAEDYAHQGQRIAFLRSGQKLRHLHRRGPSHHTQFGTNLTWKTISEKIDLSCCLIFQYVD